MWYNNDTVIIIFPNVTETLTVRAWKFGNAERRQGYKFGKAKLVFLFGNIRYLQALGPNLVAALRCSKEKGENKAYEVIDC